MLQVDLWKRVVIWVVVALGLVFAMPNAQRHELYKQSGDNFFLKFGFEITNKSLSEISTVF